ncbi:MAG TPA: nucleotidyltransferase domain-containing protein [Syntrophales bacterium]|nr:nucleotidyltransferase domain-containing protein [Syntrophales bacterium]
MSKIPKTPQEVFPEIVEDLKKIFGSELQSIILYGSGARGDYVPGKSDINFLVILAEDATKDLEKVVPMIPKWKKRAVATPLFMTKAFICSSIDVYPVEFLNMKRHYRVVHGEDVLKDLVFDGKALRLQCERELKGKLVLLHTGFLDTAGKAEDLRGLMAASITAVLSVFGALLLIQGREIPKERRDIVPAVTETYGLDAEPFLRCIDLREGKKDPSLGNLKAVFQSYTTEIQKLIKAVDNLLLP